MKLLDSWEKVVEAIKVNMAAGGSNMISWPSNTQNWLTSFWSYIQRNQIALNTIEGLHAIPILDKNMKYLHKVMTTDSFMVTSYNYGAAKISQEMKQFLQDFGIKMVDESYITSYALDHLFFAGKVLRPDPAGLIKTTSHVCDMHGVSKINQRLSLSGTLRGELQNAIQNHAENLPTNIFNLNIFDVHKGSFQTSTNKLILVDESAVPKDWKPNLADIIIKQSLTKSLLVKLKVPPSRCWTYEDLAQSLLKNIGLLNDAETNSLFMELIQHISQRSVPDEFLRIIKEHVMVKSDTVFVYPSSLFLENKNFKVLFSGEKNKFPCELYKPYLNGLCKLGLKTELHQVTWNDITDSVKSISSMESTESLLKKVELVIRVGVNQKFQMNSLNHYKWIPVDSVKPYEYPQSLRWYGNDQINLQRPIDISLPKHSKLIGATQNVVEKSLAKEFERMRVNAEPPVNTVMSHLQYVIQSYDADERKNYQDIVLEIYRYLASKPVKDVSGKMKEMGLNIWQGKNFIQNEKLLLNAVTFNVEPYYFVISEDVKVIFGTVLEELGCGQKAELDIYICVLKQMKIHHESPAIGCRNKDLTLAIDLCKYIANHAHLLSNVHRENLVLPIHCDLQEGIRFAPLNDCHYHDFDEQQPFSSVPDCNILHPLLGEEFAENLNIANVVNEVLSGGEDLFQSWGQHESLTLRLNRLLKDYEDGLAIPKELIQNADDAGATEVAFLFDERENLDLTSLLINQKLKHWQGPALWVYNNGRFTEQDFRNITKLNAGTKEADTAKIGRFGLGFNSVYHLTDLPSFMSGNTMIIFDPHAKYLGKALKDKTKPGLRIPLVKSKKDLALFNDQFKVYHGIFGAHLDFENNDVEEFDGTIFRLPLRQFKTAQASEISKLVYDNNEMHLLLTQLQESLDRLLLFTQNVTKVQCFHLPKSASSSDEARLMFSVMKSSEKPDLPRLNILKKAAHILTEYNPCYDVPVCNSIEKITVTVKEKEKLRKRQWIISSCIGKKTSFDFAQQNKGYSPCGGVALEYETMDDGTILPIAHDVKDYCIFCFLPLPESSHLPLHLNGAFEVSNDRKGLVKISTDQKRHDTTSNWNDLLGKDLTVAYLNLLNELKLQKANITLDDWFKLMPAAPLPHENSCVMELIKCLLSELLRSGIQIFPVVNENQRRWMPWSDLVALCNEVPHDLRKLVIKFMNWLYHVENKGNACVEIPSSFKVMLSELGFNGELKSITLDLDEFYCQFFKYVDSDLLDISLRNCILHQLLSTNSHGILKEYLKNQPCIPTEPNGKLKIPCELVRADGKVANLFDEEDEVFPRKEFECYSSHLESLGMNSSSLTWPLILDRAKTIESFNDHAPELKLPVEKLMKRSKDLLQHISVSELDTCPLDVKRQLLQTQFLPIMQKPENSLFPVWRSQGCIFGSPSEMLHQSHCHVACCSSLICCELYYPHLSTFLTLDRDPPFEVVKEQLSQLINVCQRKGKVDQDVKDKLELIYDHMSKTDIDIATLKGFDMIYSESGDLVSPDWVFAQTTVEIPGFLYKLPKRLYEKYQTLMLALGVKKECTVEDLLNILKTVSMKHEKNVAPEAVLNPILHSAVPFLVDNYEKGDLDLQIYLPNNCGVMTDVRDLSFKDVPWMPDDHNICYSHEAISAKYCMQLGIKPSRNTYLQNNSIGLAFGQHEDLTTRIKNLLKGYADSEDVLNEILQNADDAGATEVSFILDTRNHASEKVFSDEWKQVQGPALLVCNDGLFTESDLKAIQNLGEGNKSTNALKTGKYGVGFNAVYHITDCPSFLTKIDGKEDVLCVFDPNLRYAPGATKELPGIMITNARDKMKNTFTDLESAYLIDCYETENKTLFRLPLRNSEMARVSLLSQSEISVDQMEEKLKRMKKAASRVLLFLNNVKSLKFKVIDPNGNPRLEETFNAKSYNVTEKKIRDFRLFQKKFTSKLGNVAALMKQNSQISRSICMQHHKDNDFVETIHFNVVEQCGFSNMESLPKEILKMMNTNHLCLAPKGGAACVSSDIICEHCESLTCSKSSAPGNLTGFSDKFGLFCTLPLPQQSPIPLLINGNFVLDYETRRAIWTKMDSDEGIWNMCILTNCVLPCYIKSMLFFTEELCGPYKESEIEKKRRSIKNYYNKFPVVERSENQDSYWHVFQKAFFTHILEFDVSLLAVEMENEKDIFFCPPKEFLLFELNLNEVSKPSEQRPPLLKVLQSALLKTDLLPKKIVESFSFCNHDLQIMNPSIARQQLITQTHNLIPELPDAEKWKIERTVFQSKENVLMVLEYCLKKEKEDEQITIEGLPLCLLADETLVSFTRADKKFCSPYSDLINGKEDLFVYFRSVPILKNVETLDCFKPFTLDEFANLLGNTLPEGEYKNKLTAVPYNTTEVQEIWLQSVWKYIGSQIEKTLAEADKVEESSTQALVASDELVKNEAAMSNLQTQQVNIDTILKPIADWSLLLCKQNEKLWLIPVKYCKNVIHFKSQPQQSHLINHAPIIFNSGTLNPISEATNALEKHFKIYVSSHVGSNRSPTLLARSVARQDEVKFVYNHKTALKLFGTMDSYQDIINALTFCYEQKAYSSVNSELADCILRILPADMEPELKEKLKMLPLFENGDGTVVAVKDKPVTVLPKEAVPPNGLNIVEKRNGCYFLRHKADLTKLFEGLGFTTTNIYGFYVSCIFPVLQDLSLDDVCKHLVCIRDVVLENGMVDNKAAAKVAFHQLLRCAKCVPCRQNGNTILKAASEVFDRTNEVFVLMLQDSDFPLPKYVYDKKKCDEAKDLESSSTHSKSGKSSKVKHDCTKENCKDQEKWHTFLKKIGMITEVNQEIFVRFGRMLETEPDDKKAERVSKHLVDVLLKMFPHGKELENEDDLNKFLNDVATIKFILPFKLNKSLESVCQSKNAQLISASEKRMCIKEAASYYRQNLVWTTMKILPHSLNPFSTWLVNQLHIKKDLKGNYVKRKQKGPADEPAQVVTVKVNGNSIISFHNVSQQIRNITCELTCLTTSCKLIGEKWKDTYHETLKEVYTYLDEVSHSRDVNLKYNKHMIECESFILVDDGLKLETPLRAVLVDQNTIPPYLNAVCDELGPYYQMFGQLGCARYPTSQHYMHVLKQIHNECSGKCLEANELRAITKAVYYFSQLLKSDNNLRDTELYLPTISLQNKREISLALSPSAVCMNDISLLKRLQHFTERMLLPSYDKFYDNDTVSTLTKNLPSSMRPMLLSEVVEEVVVVKELKFQTDVMPDHISGKIKKRFISPQFIKAIERLLKHEASIDITNQLEIITEALKKVEVFVCIDLKTHLSFKNRVIHNSSEAKSLFLKFSGEKFQIYFDAKNPCNESEIFSDVASGLLDSLGKPFQQTKSILLLPELLKVPLHEIPALLGKKGIRLEMADANVFNVAGPPRPGELVPLELHALLINDFVKFKVGDYVAVEVEGDANTYVYAIIHQVNDGLPFNVVYGVQTTDCEGVITDLPASQLFGFSRFKELNSTAVAKQENCLLVVDEMFDNARDNDMSYEEAIEEVDQLLSFFKEKNERKKIVRRLYLRWHPDKHQSRTKSLATGVFQYIQEKLKKMNEGYEFDFAHWDERAGNDSKSYARYKKNFEKKFSSFNTHGMSDFSTPPTFESNRQPAEARRWLRQAKCDLIAMNHGQSPEWICQMAHQASEKALKAACYQINYRRNNDSNLVHISAQLNDKTLQQKAKKLEQLVTSQKHMRLSSDTQ